MVRLQKLIAGAALGLVLTASAVGATVCKPHDFAIEKLGAKNADVMGIGITRDGLGLVELVVNPNGDWAILVTDRNKLSCMTYQGTDWVGSEGPQPTTLKLQVPTLTPEGETNGSLEVIPLPPYEEPDTYDDGEGEKENDAD